MENMIRKIVGISEFLAVRQPVSKIAYLKVFFNILLFTALEGNKVTLPPTELKIIGRKIPKIFTLSFSNVH